MDDDLGRESAQQQQLVHKVKSHWSEITEFIECRIANSIILFKSNKLQLSRLVNASGEIILQSGATTANILQSDLSESLLSKEYLLFPRGIDK